MLEQSISLDLMTKTIYKKKSPNEFSLVTCNPSETISDVLHRMEKKRLISLPVVELAVVIGSVSVYDIAMYFQTGEKARRWTKPILKVLNFIAITGGRKMTRTMTHWIPYPLSTVLTLESLVIPFSSGMHRILIEVKSIDGFTRHLRNVSQTDVLRYIYEYQNLLPPDLVQHNLKSLEAVTQNVVTCKTTDNLLDSLKLLDYCYMTALAVVEPQNGELVSTLSASDLRYMKRDTLAKLNEMTVKQFLANNSNHNDMRKPVMIDEYTDGLITAIERMLFSRTHRLWLVDDFRRPYGVLSMSDIFRVISGRPRRSSPIRDETGRPITSLNKLQQWSQKGSSSVDKAECKLKVPEREMREPGTPFLSEQQAEK
jgi:CBS domain-containing protein